MTLVLSWLTAQQTLFRIGGLRGGEKVLILGGNGAVGQAAIVLAKAAGAQVYATAREVHHDQLRQLGANPLPRNGWIDAVKGEMDVVLDGVAADRFRDSARALAPQGRLVVIGMTALVGEPIWTVLAAMLSLLWLYLVPNGKKTLFYSITSRRKAHPAEFRADLETLFGHLEAGTIRPQVAQRIGFDEVAASHRALDAGGLSGKIVLDPWS